mmetsp:Transcript_9766/g.35788  ORF Transcript_9766/g.35788 Transcript_9766/m.35788 type:complete len:192 (+) Transcript_9766:40-615(+)
MGQCLSGVSDAPGPAYPPSEVLFFPDPQMPCHSVLRGQHCKRHNCAYAHTKTSLVSLIALLNKATTSLDACVFTITCNEIATALIDAKRRGVKVRVITDYEQSRAQGSDIQKIREAGISVVDDRQQRNSEQSHMHHKFCVVDHKLLLNGSFNWTRNAVLSNQENLVISAEANLVSKFEAHFIKLWKLYGGK